jgi:hypothetical protein
MASRSSGWAGNKKKVDLASLREILAKNIPCSGEEPREILVLRFVLRFLTKQIDAKGRTHDAERRATLAVNRELLTFLGTFASINCSLPKAAVWIRSGGEP